MACTKHIEQKIASEEQQPAKEVQRKNEPRNEPPGGEEAQKRVIYMIRIRPSKTDFRSLPAADDQDKKTR